MIDKIKDAVSRCRDKDRIDQWVIIEELYQKLEKEGHHHTEIFLAFQDIIVNNIKTLGNKLNGTE